ncbi:hypothetical protein BDN72DRAFT_471077 [Pluteus cervinus]|uniref:Uncharacterized protein n=1 Tax=Pluteus cervinus TaxID=181527 RepID=A0ACD3B135_9AGAR|nr:hypothetical protein BDN72DRAFT_471077 [Pluteus cervinus]
MALFQDDQSYCRKATSSAQDIAWTFHLDFRRNCGLPCTPRCLFSRAIRHALAISLSNPESLFYISNGVLIAIRKLISDSLRPKWTIAAAIRAIASMTMNARYLTARNTGLTMLRKSETFVTPHLIQLTTDMSISTAWLWHSSLLMDDCRKRPSATASYFG